MKEFYYKNEDNEKIAAVYLPGNSSTTPLIVEPAQDISTLFDDLKEIILQNLEIFRRTKIQLDEKITNFLNEVKALLKSIKETLELIKDKKINFSHNNLAEIMFQHETILESLIDTLETEYFSFIMELSLEEETYAKFLFVLNDLKPLIKEVEDLIEQYLPQFITRRNNLIQELSDIRTRTQSEITNVYQTYLDAIEIFANSLVNSLDRSYRALTNFDQQIRTKISIIITDFNTFYNQIRNFFREVKEKNEQKYSELDTIVEPLNGMNRTISEVIEENTNFSSFLLELEQIIFEINRIYQSLGEENDTPAPPEIDFSGIGSFFDGIEQRVNTMIQRYLERRIRHIVE